MKKQVNAQIGIVFASLTLILGIFALFLLNGSAAWFASSNTVDANGFTVKVDTDNLVTATLKSYPITDINEETRAYTVSRSKERYELPTDDPNSIGYSEYKKALAIIITVESHANTTIDIFLKADSTVSTVITPTLSNYISNCISITPADLSDDGLTATRKEDSFSQVFVDLSKNPIEKSMALTLSENINVTEGSTQNICFIIEYDDALLQYIGDKILEQHLSDNKINYYDDLEFQIHS